MKKQILIAGVLASSLVSTNLFAQAQNEQVEKLEQILFKNPSLGSIGIGHVRWATHGVPNEINAHPHSSEEVSVVHNGIIENSDALKKELELKGAKFKSQTDTEVIVHLITEYLKDNDLN